MKKIPGTQPKLYIPLSLKKILKINKNLDEARFEFNIGLKKVLGVLVFSEVETNPEGACYTEEKDKKWGFIPNIFTVDKETQTLKTIINVLSPITIYPNKYILAIDLE